MKTILVRVECLCGAIAAIPEGGFYPLCGQCGRRMVPARHGEVRRNGGAIAYVAEMKEEYDAAVEVSREVAAAADGDDRVRNEEAERRWREHHSRQYTDDELRVALERCGYPTERPPWPTRPSPEADIGMPEVPYPPWEAAAV